MLERLRQLADRIAAVEGYNTTVVPYLTVIRRSHPTPLATAVLSPSFCLILQGRKMVHLGSSSIPYGPGDFLTSMIDIPAAGHVIEANPEQPYLGLRVDFTTDEIAEVMMEAGIRVETRNERQNAAAFVGRSSEELLNLFIRILKLQDETRDTGFLARHLRKELIFRLLSGEYGYLFSQNALFDPHAEGIGRIVRWIRDNYAKRFTVEQLAKLNGMSVSGLHHKFKAVTTMGPLQYQKQFRLQEARRLLLSGSLDATAAAFEVGYESPSQFTREYKRQFGLPPLKDMRALRKVGLEA